MCHTTIQSVVVVVVAVVVEAVVVVAVVVVVISTNLHCTALRLSPGRGTEETRRDDFSCSWPFDFGGSSRCSA